MDNLQTIIDKQKELQERLGYDMDNMGQEERTAFIKEMSLHLVDEVHEMLRELPYLKPWKTYEEDTEAFATQNIAARVEFIDALHFMMNIGLALGFDDADLMCDLYVTKNDINHKRQEEGY